MPLLVHWLACAWPAEQGEATGAAFSVLHHDCCNVYLALSLCCTEHCIQCLSGAVRAGDLWFQAAGCCCVSVPCHTPQDEAIARPSTWSFELQSGLRHHVYAPCSVGQRAVHVVNAMQCMCTRHALWERLLHISCVGVGRRS
jgi:hypothetical protein